MINRCRACGNATLLEVLDLGEQALTGVFPRSRDEAVPSAPLVLVKCSPDGCGLVQLRDTVDPQLMYGPGYGYQSSIRPFMANHLAGKAATAKALVDLGDGDLVLDIGSNDGTLLRTYTESGLTLVGIDPSAEKYRDLYPRDADLIVDFFTKDVYTAKYGDRRAKIVTSIAMFYDLPDPLGFMKDVSGILADDGIWLIEHSYLPSMLEATSYDTVCHEHLEYYSLKQIEWMAERAGLAVVSAEITDVYGGSLCVALAKQGSPVRPDTAAIARIRAREHQLALDDMTPFKEFASRTENHREQLRALLETSLEKGKTTLGYGASTKGNVILQYCGIDERLLPCIGEVSTEKTGRFAPGTGIPIVSEEDAKSRRPDQLLVLPWVYRDGFLEREQEYLAGGGRMIFPLPEISVEG